jgi:ABC-type multidrug transport system fused ATPase/permease subunit
LIEISTLKKAWALLDAREKRHAWIVLAIVVLGALSSALMVGSVFPFLSVLSDPGRIETVAALAWAYETFGFTSDYAFLVGLGLTSLGVIVLTSGIQIFKSWAVARFSMMRMHSISYRLMEAYLRQPYEFFLDRHSGEMGTRILAESQQLVMQFFRPAAEAVAAVFTVLAIVGLLLWVEPVVALIAFGLLGGIYGAIYALSRRALKRLGRIRVDANSARFRIANEALGGVKDIKLLGRERSYVARYSGPSRQMARTQVMVQVISATPQFALQAVAFGGMILLCLALMDADELASGAALGRILPIIGIFAFAGQRLMPELSKLYQSLAKLQAGEASVDIIHDDLIDRAGGGALPRSIPSGLGLRDRLTFENVSYHYPNATHAGVRDITLEIDAGEKIGIVGGTGAGKTTLADLILGLLSPRAGRLVVDGVPLTEANLREWQQSVGYVPQDIFLTDASVTENIALGVPPDEIDQARVEEAARIAKLDQFIRIELQDGYATAIGERGVRLSGGQRQRIGIARALYHDADVIVFDEATSALDNLTEREVMAAIDALPGEKTVVMIAHRLSTVERCDRIVVMEQGRMVGCDSWAALMAENSAFQRIAQAHQTAS